METTLTLKKLPTTTVNVVYDNGFIIRNNDPSGSEYIKENRDYLHAVANLCSYILLSLQTTDNNIYENCLINTKALKREIKHHPDRLGYSEIYQYVFSIYCDLELQETTPNVLQELVDNGGLI